MAAAARAGGRCRPVGGARTRSGARLAGRRSEGAGDRATVRAALRRWCTTSARARGRWAGGWPRCSTGRSTGCCTTVTPTSCASPRPPAAPASADGSPVTVETRLGDLTALVPEVLAGRDTPDGLGPARHADRRRDRPPGAHLRRCRMPHAVHPLGHRRRARSRPSDPLDAALRAAFNDHQRRTTGGRTLLGPDAVRAAAGAFVRAGGAGRGAAEPVAARGRRRGAAPRVARRLGRCRMRAAAGARHRGGRLPRPAGRGPRPLSPRGHHPPPRPAGGPAGPPP